RSRISKKRRASNISIGNLRIADGFTAYVASPNWAEKIGSLFGNVSEAQAGSCTRNCARMTMFLLVLRKGSPSNRKLHFPVVNRLFFETKRNVVKSTISEF